MGVPKCPLRSAEVSFSQSFCTCQTLNIPSPLFHSQPSLSDVQNPSSTPSPPVSSRILITSSGSRPQLIVCIIPHCVGSDHGPSWRIPIVSVDHDNGLWITAAPDHGGSWSQTKKINKDSLTIYLLLVASIALLSVLEEGSLACGSSWGFYVFSSLLLRVKGRELAKSN